MNSIKDLIFLQARSAGRVKKLFPAMIIEPRGFSISI